MNVPTLVFDDGTQCPVTGVLLVGRAPKARFGEVVDGVFAVGGETATVTNTHMAVGVDDDGVWICDRNSVAGTRIIKSDGRAIDCPAGRRIAIPAGSRVWMGKRSFALAGDDTARPDDPTPAAPVAAPRT